mmetsp:Transcript_35456/g.34492  ORF Transcript_35456/g.34492 Transcript_35456/m.34492 type:complete len:145 (+) Transcript_35456:1062-1496(+)
MSAERNVFRFQRANSKNQQNEVSPINGGSVAFQHYRSRLANYQPSSNVLEGSQRDNSHEVQQINDSVVIQNPPSKLRKGFQQTQDIAKIYSPNSTIKNTNNSFLGITDMSQNSAKNGSGSQMNSPKRGSNFNIPIRGNKNVLAS